MLHLKVDQVIIRHLMSNEAVGYYAAALRLSESTYFVPVVICTSLLPPMLNARSKSVGLYRTRLQQLFNLMVLLSLGIALPVTFLGDWIIDLVFGKAYHPAGAVLVLHIWSGVFVALGVAANGWLIAENLHRIALYRTLLGVVINIGLNFALIPSSASRVRPWQPSSPRRNGLLQQPVFRQNADAVFHANPGVARLFGVPAGPAAFHPAHP
jgi:O-antigen/teichoic acid export membrane protein